MHVYHIHTWLTCTWRLIWTHVQIERKRGHTVGIHVHIHTILPVTTRFCNWKSRPNSYGSTRSELLLSLRSLSCSMSPISTGRLRSLLPDRSRWRRLERRDMSAGIRCGVKDGGRGGGRGGNIQKQYETQITQSPMSTPLAMYTYAQCHTLAYRFDGISVQSASTVRISWQLLANLLSCFDLS